MVTPRPLRERNAGDTFPSSRAGRCYHCQEFTVRRMVRQSKSGHSTPARSAIATTVSSRKVYVNTDTEHPPGRRERAGLRPMRGSHSCRQTEGHRVLLARVLQPQLWHALPTRPPQGWHLPRMRPTRHAGQNPRGLPRLPGQTAQAEGGMMGDAAELTIHDQALIRATTWLKPYDDALDRCHLRNQPPRNV